MQVSRRRDSGLAKAARRLAKATAAHPPLPRGVVVLVVRRRHARVLL
jgi:hypothetical protein